MTTAMASCGQNEYQSDNDVAIYEEVSAKSESNNLHQPASCQSAQQSDCCQSAQQSDCCQSAKPAPEFMTARSMNEYQSVHLPVYEDLPAKPESLYLEPTSLRQPASCQPGQPARALPAEPVGTDTAEPEESHIYEGLIHTPDNPVSQTVPPPSTKQRKCSNAIICVLAVFSVFIAIVTVLGVWLGVAMTPGIAVLNIPEHTCITVAPGDLTWPEEEVICRADDEGWLTWLRRVDASVLFNRTWDEYVTGFGDPAGNYWLGLQTLHRITGGRPQQQQQQHREMRVRLETWGVGRRYWFEYGTFSVGDNASDYTLTIGNYTGSHDDSNAFDHPTRSRHRLDGRRFSTWDRDNDNDTDENCSEMYGGGGGWWYGGCGNLLPTALYGANGESYYPYIWWRNVYAGDFSVPIKSLQMQIKYNDS